MKGKLPLNLLIKEEITLSFCIEVTSKHFKDITIPFHLLLNGDTHFILEYLIIGGMK